tara:strand:+ start:191 stop:580 length:390 start_codon:yes stop_codon:yes gene_type:complete
MNKEIIKKYFKDGETAQNTLEELGLFEQIAKQYILTKDLEIIKEFINLRPKERGEKMKYNDEIGCTCAECKVGEQYEIRELVIINFIEWYASEEEDREPLRQAMQLYLQQELWIDFEGMKLKDTREKGE